MKTVSSFLAEVWEKFQFLPTWQQFAWAALGAAILVMLALIGYVLIMSKISQRRARKQQQEKAIREKQSIAIREMLAVLPRLKLSEVTVACRRAGIWIDKRPISIPDPRLFDPKLFGDALGSLFEELAYKNAGAGIPDTAPIQGETVTDKLLFLDSSMELVAEVLIRTDAIYLDALIAGMEVRHEEMAVKLKSALSAAQGKADQERQEVEITRALARGASAVKQLTADTEEKRKALKRR